MTTTCPACRGDNSPSVCPTCRGNGCRECTDGVVDDPCWLCAGEGSVDADSDALALAVEHAEQADDYATHLGRDLYDARREVAQLTDRVFRLERMAHRGDGGVA